MGDLASRLVSSDVLYVAVLLAVAGSAVALIVGVRYLLSARSDLLRDRLRRTVGSVATGLPDVAPAPTIEQDRQPGLLQSLFAPFARVARPSDEEEMGRLRARLSAGGYRRERAVVFFLGAKVLLMVGLAALVLWFNANRPQPLRYAALFTVLAMTIGFYLPTLWLSGRVKERQGAINRGLPDALDLLVTCVEAGLGLDQALNRVSSETALSAPILSAEMSRAALEMRAGMARGEAFRRMASRTGVEELRNLAAIIIQTEIFGTSIAQSLRVQAEAMRVRRMQRAEERAATVAVKLTVPLIFCILPALFAVLMGPAAVRIMRILLPKLTGG